MSGQLTVPQVLSWNPGLLAAQAKEWDRQATELETKLDTQNGAVGDSADIFSGIGGDAMRDRFAQDSASARKIVDALEKGRDAAKIANLNLSTAKSLMQSGKQTAESKGYSVADDATCTITKETKGTLLASVQGNAAKYATALAALQVDCDRETQAMKARLATAVNADNDAVKGISDAFADLVPAEVLSAMVAAETGQLSPARAAAVAYANQWALNHNPDYEDFPSQDCTNFISQCLRAAGFKDEGDGGVPFLHYDESGRWYYNHHDDLPDDESWTWTSAPKLHDYLLRSDPKPGTPSGTEVQTGKIDATTTGIDPLALSHAGLKPGDIVQYELSSGAHAGEINHSAIYVGQKEVTMPNGQTVLADVVDYHTHDNLQVPWSLQLGSPESFPLKYHMIQLNYPGD